LDITWLAGGRLLRSIQPNCGRTNKTKPRRNPVKNPPICAKLSTWGKIPTAKLITMISRRVSRAAAY